MADLGSTFDPGEIPADDRSLEPIPAGDYVCQVVESEVVDIKSGKGRALRLTLEVVEGTHERRKVWDRLNIRHESAVAQSIAQRALADLCEAVGLGPIRDSDKLHFKPFVARIAIRTDPTGQYDPQNEVKRYRSRGGRPPASGSSAPAQRPAPAASTPAQATGNRPWSRPAQQAAAEADPPF